jgi:transposase
MLQPIDRSRRAGPLYPGSTKTLCDFIDPRHLLRRIAANFDFAALVAVLQTRYDPWIGRPAIPPEVVIRALVLMVVYQVSSERQVCERIGEHLAWRWFCHLTLEDAVGDHSTLSVFRERLGSERFQELLARLNEELARRALLSSRTDVDSTPIEANVRLANLESTDLPPAEFAQRATAEDDIFVVRETIPADPVSGEPARLQFTRYQDKAGRLPLSLGDPDARWRRPKPQKPAILGDKENVIVDKAGFILARQGTPAESGDVAGAEPLLDRLPLLPKSRTGDSAYGTGAFRQMVRRRGITLSAPLKETHDASASTLLATGAFVFHADHLTCRAEKVLYPTGFPTADGTQMFVAPPGACAVCPLREECLPPKQDRRQVGLSRHQFAFRRAQDLNATVGDQREMRRRKTLSEGVFARLDRLGWDTARVRGIEKVACPGSIAAIAHNILKALTKVRFGKRAAGAKRTTALAINLPAPLCLSFHLSLPFTRPLAFSL